MSVEKISLVLNHSKARGTQKLVLIGIANHHGDEGAWPSVATLARYANLSERRVQQTIRELESMGEIRIEKNAGSGFRQYKTNRYWILTEAPEDSSGVKPASLRGEADFVSGVKPVSPETLKETEDNHLKEFDIFWEKFPRHENKAGAQRAFKKAIKKIDFEKLMDRLDAYIRHNQKHNIIFAYASTWLNQERWIDEYDAPSAKQMNREREWTQEFLREQAEAEKHATAPPKCEHGNSIVRCRICVGK